MLYSSMLLEIPSCSPQPKSVFFFFFLVYEYLLFLILGYNGFAIKPDITDIKSLSPCLTFYLQSISYSVHLQALQILEDKHRN